MMLKGILLLSIGCLMSIKSWTQEIEPIVSDTTVTWYQQVDWTNLGINGQISRQSALTPGGRQLGGWVSAGLFIKKWNGGVFISTYEDSYFQTIIFPNQFSLNYLYGGIYAGYTLLQKRWVQVNITGAVGKGDVIWERTTTFENYYRDIFNMYHLMLDIESTPIRFIRPIIQVGYRWMSPIDLPLLTSVDFTGLSVIFGVRLALYTHRPNP